VARTRGLVDFSSSGDLPERLELYQPFGDAVPTGEGLAHGLFAQYVSFAGGPHANLAVLLLLTSSDQSRPSPLKMNGGSVQAAQLDKVR
jgi:hypothetical protein